jgi:hypothetical protein
MYTIIVTRDEMRILQARNRTNAMEMVNDHCKPQYFQKAFIFEKGVTW